MNIDLFLPEFQVPFIMSAKTKGLQQQLVKNIKQRIGLKSEELYFKFEHDSTPNFDPYSGPVIYYIADRIFHSDLFITFYDRQKAIAKKNALSKTVA